MKIDKNFIINLLLVFAIIFLGYQNYCQNQMIYEQTVQLSSKNEDKKNTTIVYEQKLESLKKNNKSLYDSLKIYKEQIDYLAQFKYKKKYTVRDTIIKYDTINNIIPQTINEYTYSNKNENDTLNYQLKIGSVTQPNWYELNLEVSDKFTLVNKKVDNVNETTIETNSNNTNISDVTILKTKENKTLKDKIEIGPSITAGYCLNGKTFDIVVGVSATFDIW